ncbi:MAG: NEAT domain-containing protein [Clostridiales bacterium]|nr:NEAT domain-containing protein [Clostridiales bacterium]MBS5878242.1 NEAT domain-containing protein [Clostridiales bacterium]
MSKRLNFKGPLSVAALSALVATGISAGTATPAFAEAPVKTVTKVKAPVEDGVYYADVNLVNASQLDQYSMGNLSVRGSAGFKERHPEDSSYRSLVVVENGKAHAIVEFMPMGFIGTYGFLSELDEVTPKKIKYAPVEGETTYRPAMLMSSHQTKDGKAVYDAFNNPASPSKLDGTKTRPAGYGREESKPNIVDKPYARMMCVDVTPIQVEGDPVAKTPADFSSVEGRIHNAFSHVFVPVMFDISQSSGDQYARLNVDWTSVTKVNDPETNMRYSLYKAMNKEKEGQLNYTSASFANLQNTISEVRNDITKVWPSQKIEMNGTGFQAQPKLMQKDPTPAEEAAYAKKLNDAVNALEERGSKEDLKKAINDAKEKLKEKDKYKSETVTALETAIEKAEGVAASDDAGRSVIEKVIADLTTAVNGLAVKPTEPAPKPDPAPKPEEPTPKPDPAPKSGEPKTLDKDHLADGVYSISGEMLKTNLTDKSMSNDAINHQIKLTVKDGKYYVTMQFKGLNIGDKLGYLGKLKYFRSGYTKDGFSNPVGPTADAQVDSYHKGADGNNFKDQYGTNYPEYVTFELIPEALKDGLVPLQVFVPVMESISTGTGTQPVYLSLNWKSLKATQNDDPGFNDKTIGKGNLVLPGSTQLESLSGGKLGEMKSGLKNVKTGDDSGSKVLAYTGIVLAAAGVATVSIVRSRKNKKDEM